MSDPATKPIHPSDIKPEHYCMAALHDMVESWRGIPRGQVPPEVRMVAWMFRQMESQLHQVEMIDGYLNMVRDQLERQHREELKRLEDVRDRMGMVNLHLHMLKDHVRAKHAASANAGAGDSDSNVQGVRGPASRPNQKRVDTSPTGSQTGLPLPQTRQRVGGTHSGHAVCSGGERRVG